MLKYDFMRNAFLIGGLIALIIPMIGTVVVFKRMSMVGDAISHTSLAGITLGLIFGFNPLLAALLMSIFSALVLEYVSLHFSNYKELSISILMSIGVGLSAVFSSFLQNPANLNMYLFGSVLSIVKSDIIVTVILSLIIIFISLRFYRSFFYIAFDEKSAQLAGVNVKRTSLIFTLTTAISVSLASKMMGALVVSSLLVIPVAASMQVSFSYKQTMIIACLVSLFSMFLGLILSYHFDLVPGGTIVLSSVAVLFISFLLKRND